jgi:hypothetical protein
MESVDMAVSKTAAALLKTWSERGRTPHSSKDGRPQWSRPSSRSSWTDPTSNWSNR